MTYDPKSAAWALARHMKQRQQATAENPSSLLPQLVDESGTAFKKAPDSVVFFLLEWLGGGLKLPEDFATVGTSAKALKEHTRPDGGVYLGAFDLKDAEGSTVIVFGDPLMDEPHAIQLTHAFRKHHAEQAAKLGTGPTPQLVS